MQAINHVATALLLKKKIPAAPLFGLILAVEAVEYLWVALNLIGVEQTIIDTDMASVADVHLVHMPFSHSIVGSLIFAILVGGVILWRGGRARYAVAGAMALGTLSHILLDLVVHAPDIALAPLIDEAKFGTGLYATVPLVALGVETLWGIYCWWIYRGSLKLLGFIIFMGATSIPFYSNSINTGEAALGGQSTTFAVFILAQMVVTSVLVWWLAK
jgi:hypothetical protein